LLALLLSFPREIAKNCQIDSDTPNTRVNKNKAKRQKWPEFVGFSG